MDNFVDDPTEQFVDLTIAKACYVKDDKYMCIPCFKNTEGTMNQIIHSDELNDLDCLFFRCNLVDSISDAIDFIDETFLHIILPSTQE